MSLTLNAAGLQYQPELYELLITYGGHERVVLVSDRPYSVFEDLDRLHLKPNFILRRKTKIIAGICSGTNLLAEPATNSPTAQV